MVEKRNLVLCGNLALSVLLVLGGICILAAGVHTFNVDPRKASFAYHRTDGRTSRNPFADVQYTHAHVAVGAESYATNYDSLYSCDGLTGAFHRNESYRLSDRCRLVPNELAQDADGDGKYGDDKGYVYPGAPDVVKCEDYYEPTGTEVCLGPNGCSTLNVIKYHANNVFVGLMNNSCKTSQSMMSTFIAAGVLTIVTGLVYLYVVFQASRSSYTAKPAAGSIGNALAIISFCLVTMGAVAFFNSSPAASQLRKYMDCASMSKEAFTSGNMGYRPVSQCYVDTAECNPYNFSSNRYPVANTLGDCLYVSGEIMNIVDCEAATKDLKDADEGAPEDCEAVDCQHVVEPYGEHYTSKCCQARRRCCGDSALCAYGTSICQFNASITIGDKTETNVCTHQLAERIHKCNPTQEAAFNSRLRQKGKCMKNILPSATSEQLAGGYLSGVLEECTPDMKKRLAVSTSYWANETANADVEKLQSVAYVEENLHDCLVAKYGGCVTECATVPLVNCTITAPFIGAPGNCIVRGTECVPDASHYGEKKVQEERPMEYCESLFNPDDVEGSKAACLSSNLCIWSSALGYRDGCFSRDCPGMVSNGFYGYQSKQNPPCQANGYRGGENSFIGPKFKVCNDPEKGCLPSGQSALCRTRSSNSNSHYWQGVSGAFSPGPALDFVQCQAATVENCMNIVLASSGTKGCVLLANDKGETVCSSAYVPCTGDALNVHNIALEAAKAKVGNEAGALSMASVCHQDSAGNYFTPITYELYLTYVFYALGTALSIVGTLGYIFMWPFL